MHRHRVISGRPAGVALRENPHDILQRDVWALQMDLWAVAFVNGRRMVSVPLAQVGDSIRRMILSEYTLEARNEKGSGIVADLTTS